MCGHFCSSVRSENARAPTFYLGCASTDQSNQGFSSVLCARGRCIHTGYDLCNVEPYINGVM